MPEDDAAEFGRRPGGRPGKKKGNKGNADRGGAWGPTKTMGSIQVRSRKGFSALMMEIKPGLYIVAQVRCDQDSFGAAGHPPVKAIAKDALTVVDQALETIFPARKAMREQREQQQAAIRRAERATRDADKSRKEADRATANARLLQAPPAPKAVTPAMAPWAATDDGDDGDDEGQD